MLIGVFFLMLFVLIDSRQHIQISREFKEQVVEPILKVVNCTDKCTRTNNIIV